MEQETFLKELEQRIARGEISREDVLRTVNADTPDASVSSKSEPSTEEKHSSITKILYTLGAAVVVLGIVFFVAQIWQDIGSFGRIGVTLVLGLIMAAAGSVLLKKYDNSLGQVFHVIAGLLIPGGALVTLYETVGVPESIWSVAITIGVIFVFYLLLTVYHRSAVLTFFAIANGTAFLYLVLGALINDSAYYNYTSVYAYLTMAVSLGYLFLSYSFRDSWNKHLVGLLNFFGALGFLGAAFSRVFDSGLWELVFFVLAIAGMVLAVHVKSKAILSLSTIFLVMHLIYITNEYFADSIGWPISLVILGFVFIGLGYVSITISKRYISGRRPFESLSS